jgi:Transcriptional regulators
MEAKPTREERPLGLPEADAYTALRKEIIELRLKPGTFASIRDLCAHYGLSRSPMRDALLRLNEEGLITLLPQRGTMISKIDFERVEEERFLRVSVEKEIMRLYMTNPSPADIARLEASLEAQKASVASKDFRNFIIQDDDFHDVFYRATGKPLCASIIRKASGHYSRVRLLTCIDMDITENILRQHGEMIAAMKSGDAQKMHTVFNHHLSKIDEEEQMLSKRYPDLFVSAGAEQKENDELNTDFLQTLRE